MSKLFEIKSTQTIGYWVWDTHVDTCAICRISLQKPSISSQAGEDKNGSGSKIAFGFCNHVYHLDCIEKWLPTRNVCPLCNKDWEFIKIKQI